MINNFHLILLIVSIILIIYLIYNLKYKRRIVLNNLATKTTEGFEQKDIGLQESKNVVAKYNRFNNIQSISNKYAKMPLHEYCIKASYNTACSGEYVSVNMVKEVLKRGCRFLDFEVFYMKENNTFMPRVGISSDKNFIILDSKNSISLNDLFIWYNASLHSPLFRRTCALLILKRVEASLVLSYCFLRTSRMCFDNSCFNCG